MADLSGRKLRHQSLLPFNEVAAFEAGAGADDLIQQRAATWRGAALVDYRRRGRAFPTDAANVGLAR